MVPKGEESLDRGVGVMVIARPNEGVEGVAGRDPGRVAGWDPAREGVLTFGVLAGVDFPFGRPRTGVR